MLGFFRKYQKYFFIFVTTIIVISFSFFGVINSLNGPQISDPVVRTAIDGTKVKKSELEQMAYFLTTDAQDKLYFGGRRGPNFLNDGVLQNDFLQSGLASVLARQYGDFLRGDLDARAKKERNFKLYRHPQAEFISVENAWNFLAPDMKRHFSQLQGGENPVSEEEFNARVQLYLGQRKLSPLTVKQVLAYQNQQYSWVPQDPNLPQTDLSVFGYKTIDDWFGPRFIRLASALILDVAKMAEQQGLKVSDDEATASLIKQTRVSYEQNKSSPYFESVNADDYLKNQLRLMHMDMKQAVNLWKKVLLFRRYFDVVGNSVLVDRLPYKNFADYASLAVHGNLYRLSDAMRLSHFQDLQRFEYYLSAVAKRDQENPLALPTEFYSSDEVARHYPEFVQKRYEVSIASVDTVELQNEVGTKEMWNWQMQDENWDLLRNTFTDLGVRDASGREDRFAALNSLNRDARNKIDQFSKEMIVKENPEWIDRALESHRPQTRIIGIRMGGSVPVLPGVENGVELAGLLDRSAPELSKYTEDGRHYYRIQRLRTAPEMDVLTFAEVKNDGSLDERLRTVLEEHYEKIREENPDKYKTASGEWKSFSDARDRVAKDYFTDVLLAVNDKVNSTEALTVDDAARYRFTEIMENLKKRVESDPENSEWILAGESIVNDNDLSPRPPLIEQWKMVKSEYSLKRSGANDEKIDRELAFSLQPGEWSGIYTPPQGDVSFFQLVKKEVEPDQGLISEGIVEGQDLLSNNAKKQLLEKTLTLIEEIQPIKLDYLRPGDEHAKLD